MEKSITDLFQKSAVTKSSTISFFTFPLCVRNTIFHVTVYQVSSVQQYYSTPNREVIVGTLCCM